MPPTGPKTMPVGPAETEAPTQRTAAEQAARSPLLRALVAKYLGTRGPDRPSG